MAWATQAAVKSHFDARLWQTAMESFTVAGLTFDLPTTILLRIDEAILDASSELDVRILQAYQALPSATPRHLQQATAKLAAFQVVSDDGVLTDRIRSGHTDVLAYFDRIAAKQLDLGIVAPRPAYRGPTVQVIPLASTTGAGAWRCR